jgi:ABC-type multidrug transport system fused ATPase/permease subunit
LKEDYFSKKFLSNSEKQAKTDGKLFFIENLPPSTVEIVTIVLLIAAFITIVLTGQNIGMAAAQAGTIVLACLRLIPVINRTIASVVMINTTAQPVEDLMNEIKLFGIKPKDFSNMGKDIEGDNESGIVSISFKDEIVLNNLSYQYEGADKPALNNIQFSIKPGEFVGITGPSGGGKSTLINILLGFLENFSGQFTVDGTSINKGNIKSLRKIIGFVDQQTFVLDDTIAKNVAFGVDEDHIDRGRVKASLEKAQLWEYVSSLPNTIDTVVGENGKLLSGGQRQRIAIARAFYRDLKILILDEASASLDVETEHKFFSYLKTLKGELAVIMIAHRLSTLKDCGKIVFIDQGRDVAASTFDELYHSNETFKKYIEFSQIKITQQE